MARLGRIVEAHRRSTGDEPPPPIDPAGKRVLVVYLFSGIGDAVLLGPGLAALAALKAKVGVLVPPRAASALALFDLPLEIHSADERDLPRVLRGGGWEIAVDLTHREGANARGWLERSRAPIKIGWLTPGETSEDAGLDRGTPDDRHLADRHWSRAAIGPLRWLGVKEPRFDLAFRLSAAAAKRAELRWPRGKGPRILIVPGSRTSEKRWAAERYAELARRLIAERNARIVLTGAPSERAELRAMAQAIGGAAVYAGRDLRTLLALIAAADLLVSNDTGPVHLAYLLDRPTVAVYSTMSPQAWGPPRAGPFVVLRMSGMKLDDALPERVAAACAELLKEAGLTS